MPFTGLSTSTNYGKLTCTLGWVSDNLGTSKNIFAMKYTWLSAILLFTVLVLSAQRSEFSYGGPGGEISSGIVRLPDGDLVMSAYTNSYSDGRAALTRVDSFGNMIWFKAYDQFRSAVGLAMESSGDLVTLMKMTTAGLGMSSDSVYLVRLSADGEMIDSIYLARFDARSLLALENGDFLVAGQTSINTDGCAFVARVSPEGEVLWSGCYGRNENDYAWTAMEDEMGNILVGGISYRPGVQIGSDGLLLKFSATGTVLWEQYVFDDLNFTNYISDIIVGPDGRYLVTGIHQDLATYQEIDLFFAIIEPTSGNVDYFQVESKLGRQLVSSLHQVDGEPGFYMVGYDNGTPNGDYDLSLSHWGFDLFVNWEEQYGGLNNEQGSTMQVVSDGTLAILGWTESFGQGERDIYLLLTDHQGQISSGMLTGTVGFDTNDNCSLDSDELRLNEWLVRVNGPFTSSYALTQGDGHYAIPLDSAQYTVDVFAPVAYWEDCLGQQSVFMTGEGQSIFLEHPQQDVTACPFLTSEVNAFFLDPCTSNKKVYVNYQNAGTQNADSAYLTLTLDPLLTITGSSQPFTQIDDHEFLFQLDTVSVNEQGQIVLTVDVSCDANEEQAFLLETSVFPDTLCFQPPPDYSGAFLDVSANCGEDDVNLTIKNIGTGAMNAAHDYVVIEDAVLLETMPVQLGSGDELNLSFPTNGTTYYLAIPQEPGAPGANLVSTAIEGCFDEFVSDLLYGFTNQFPIQDGYQNTDISYLPAATELHTGQTLSVPNGYDAEHWVSPNTDIAYVLPFRLEDMDGATRFRLTIQPAPSLSSVNWQVLQATHEYQLSIDPSGSIHLYFDLSEDAADTKGFVVVQFKQLPDLPLGTNIISEFRLQTDFDEYISDGWQAFHRVGENFVIVDVVEPVRADLKLNCYPNPAQEFVYIDIDGLPNLEAPVQIEVRNQLGQLVSALEQSGPRLTWQPTNLPAGYYQLALSQNNSLLGTIGLMLK
jgi:hypothetical protein